MDVVELKFLLTLLGYPPDYRAPLAQIRPTSELSDRNRAFRHLRDRGLVDGHEDILRFKLAPPGHALLNLDPAQLPIRDEELAVLKASQHQTLTPGKALQGVSSDERQTLLKGLADRGFIHTETRISTVWLTPTGQTYLQYECNPQGNPTISLNLLSNYLAFMRRAYAQSLDSSGSAIAHALRWKKSTFPTDDDILHLIRQLDHELGTSNYLPIFHLRHALQPPLSRDDLDQALYRLQRRDAIELSSLQEAIAYTPEQIEAGIPQDIGGALFFITVVS